MGIPRAAAESMFWKMGEEDMRHRIDKLQPILSQLPSLLEGLVSFRSEVVSSVGSSPAVEFQRHPDSTQRPRPQLLPTEPSFLMTVPPTSGTPPRYPDPAQH